MNKPSKSDITRIKKMNQIANSLKEGSAYNITRLTSIKTLCEKPKVAAQFCFYLAQMTHRKVMSMKRDEYMEPEIWDKGKQLIDKGITALDRYLKSSNKQNENHLWEVFCELEALNNEQKKSMWGPIRIIKNKYVLLIEQAIQCVQRPNEAGYWAYQTARDYTEVYDPSYGTGLNPSSAPMMKDIVAFWSHFYSIEI